MSVNTARRTGCIVAEFSGEIDADDFRTHVRQLTDLNAEFGFIKCRISDFTSVTKDNLPNNYLSQAASSMRANQKTSVSIVIDKEKNPALFGDLRAWALGIQSPQIDVHFHTSMEEACAKQSNPGCSECPFYKQKDRPVAAL